MSRIGKNPIAIPAGVDVAIDGQNVTVKGPKGTLSHVVAEPITAKIEDGQVIVERPNDERTSRSLHGLSRTLIANMIVGVTEGYKKDLEITGTGYRVVAKGKDLEFSLASPTRSPSPRPRASSSRLRRSPRRCSRCRVSTSSSSVRLLLASAS